MKPIKISTLSILLFVLLAHPALAGAQCSKDSECKGQRICEVGRCVLPAGAALPNALTTHGSSQGELGRLVSPAAPSLGAGLSVAQRALPSLARQTVYLSLYGSLSAQSWLGASGEAIDVETQQEEARQGLHGALLYAQTRYVHWGAYVSYQPDGVEQDVAFGFTTKLGGPVGRWTWLGFAFDAGVVLNGDYVGGQLFSGLAFDVLLSGRSELKIALTSRIGAQLNMYSAPEDESITIWRLRLLAQVGFSFGV